MGEAQAAYCMLLRQDAWDYEKVKEGILHYLGILKEYYQQRFQERKARDSQQPQLLDQSLRGIALSDYYYAQRRGPKMN